MMLERLIHRPIAVTMVLLSLVVLGLVSLRLLPVSLIPDTDIPYITVQAADASLSAREMDESVVKPLREQLMQVGGLQDITCESRDGSGTLRLTFNHGANMDYLFIEVNEKIDRSMASLPRMDRPKVLKADASDLPAFFLNVTLPGGGSFTQLSQFCEDVLSKRLEQLEQVAMVDVSGTLGEEILIIPDEKALSQAGLSGEAFEAAISRANIRLGSLSIRDGAYRYNVKFDSHSFTVEDIASIWLDVKGRLFQVKDLAQVSKVPSGRTGLVRSDGEQAVSLAVIKQREARMSELKDAVDTLLSSFREDYPALRFTLTRDQTQLLEYSIHSLLWNILLGVLLACVVVFLFMKDFRSPALVSLTMPSALVISMLVFYLAGMSLNIISLSGLLLGVGMMVDNTIILIDNITSRWQRGNSLQEAVLSGTREVAGPMLSSVLTTCAVFIPLVFVSGVSGALFRDEALAVTVVLLSSYLVTIFVIPVYYWWWYKGQPAFRAHSFLSRLSFEDALVRWDHRRMEWWIRHHRLCWGVLAFSALGLILCLALMPRERLPRLTRTEAILHLDWNRRLSIEENERRCAQLEAVLGPFAEQTTALVGSQQFVLEHSGQQGIQEIQLYFRCPDMPTLEKAQTALERHLAAEAAESAWHFSEAGNLFDQVFSSQEAPLVARLRPLKTQELEVRDLEEMLFALSAAPPVTETNVLFVADAQKMALYGISYATLSGVLKSALNENHLFSIVQGSHTLPVITGRNRDNLQALLSETMIEQDGRSIPVAAIMNQGYSRDLKSLLSGPEGTFYPVELEVEDRDVPRVMQQVRQTVRDNGRFEVSFSGAWFSNRKMVQEMLWTLLVALVLLYLILAAQFESLLQPLIILLEIVVDLFGALAVLWVLGESINLMSLTGLVVVAGIVINDSILKIDTINKLRRAGMNLREAVVTASSRRMKAILMTSLTTVVAVLPFLSRGSMGADLQYPMSLVIIVGMVLGTLVSLFLVPAMYYGVYAGREKA